MGRQDTHQSAELLVVTQPKLLQLGDVEVVVSLAPQVRRVAVEVLELLVSELWRGLQQNLPGLLGRAQKSNDLIANVRQDVPAGVLFILFLPNLNYLPRQK